MVQEEGQCVFCQIASGKIPAKKVYEDDKVTAVLDINPANEGHVLLLTKEHVQIMPQMNEDLTKHVGVIAKQLSQAVLRALQVEGTSIFVANGAVAGQRAPHFMLHIIPRNEGDGFSLSLPENNLNEATMKQVYNKLAPGIAKQLGKEPPKLDSPTNEKPKPSEDEKKDESKVLDEKRITNDDKTNNDQPKTNNDKPNLDNISSLLTGGK